MDALEPSQPPNAGKLETVLGAIAEGLVLVSRDGVLEPLNPPGEDLLGQVCDRRLAAGERLPEGSPLADLLARWREGAHADRSDIRTAAGAVQVDLSPVDSLDAVVVVLRDVTEERSRQEQDRRAEQGLREEILRISERERRRIGQSLHDGLCQQLVGISLLATGLESACQDPAASVIATEIVNLLSKVAEDSRRLAKGLCPVALETSGLGSALEELAGSFERLYPAVSCTLTTDGEVLGPRSSVATHLYHLVQEAMNNAVKHGQARHIGVELRRSDGEIVLVVENDGVPFPSSPAPNQAGMGLKIMRYRAEILGARLAIQEGSRGGTRIECRLPAGEPE